MKTSHDIMRERLLIAARVIVPLRIKPLKKYTLAEIRVIQWCPEFETLMRNRLLFGFYRYGCLDAQRKNGGNGYDNIGSAIERLKLYKETGNTEHLVDAANMCLVEFDVGSHPKKHFESADDDVHVRKAE